MTQSRLERVQAKLREIDLPAVLLTDMASVAWLTGFTGTFGQVVATPNQARFITDSRYGLQAVEQVTAMPSVSFATPRRAVDLLEETLQEFAVSRLGFESKNVVVDTHAQWAERLPSVELVPLPDFLGPLRAVKGLDEIDRIRRACKLTDDCYAHLMTIIKPGVTEIELRDEVIRFFKEHGAVPGYPPIVVSGERSARPHGVPSDKPFAVGDFVTMDIGAQIEGYNADLTRTVVVGEATDRHREVYDQVLKAQIEACSLLVPGANGRDIDRRTREILDEKGLAQYFGHGLGHGLGALVHDAGRLTSLEDQPIEVGQVWTVEPGVYIEGFGGVRIEDDVLVTETGPEILTHFSKELLVVG